MQTETSSREKSSLPTLVARAGLTIGAVVLCSASIGCGAGRDLKGSMTAYERGNFHRAEERCEDLEATDFEGKGQVRYLVYCGLAYYRVGRPEDAKQFLASGQKLYTSGDPAWLKPLIVDEMNKALVNLNNKLPGNAPVATVVYPGNRSSQVDDDQYE